MFDRDFSSFLKSCHGQFEFFSIGTELFSLGVLEAFTDLQDPFHHAQNLLPTRGPGRGVAILPVKKLCHLFFCCRETQTPEEVSILFMSICYEKIQCTGVKGCFRKHRISSVCPFMCSPLVYYVSVFHSHYSHVKRFAMKNIRDRNKIAQQWDHTQSNTL